MFKVKKAIFKLQTSSDVFPGENKAAERKSWQTEFEQFLLDSGFVAEKAGYTIVAASDSETRKQEYRIYFSDSSGCYYLEIIPYNSKTSAVQPEELIPPEVMTELLEYFGIIN